jgi:translation initiation factor IF-2
VAGRRRLARPQRRPRRRAARPLRRRAARPRRPGRRARRCGDRRGGGRVDRPRPHQPAPGRPGRPRRPGRAPRPAVRGPPHPHRRRRPGGRAPLGSTAAGGAPPAPGTAAGARPASPARTRAAGRRCPARPAAPGGGPCCGACLARPGRAVGPRRGVGPPGGDPGEPARGGPGRGLPAGRRRPAAAAAGRALGRQAPARDRPADPGRGAVGRAGGARRAGPAVPLGDAQRLGGGLPRRGHPRGRAGSGPLGRAAPALRLRPSSRGAGPGSLARALADALARGPRREPVLAERLRQREASVAEHDRLHARAAAGGRW